MRIAVFGIAFFYCLFGFTACRDNSDKENERFARAKIRIFCSNITQKVPNYALINWDDCKDIEGVKECSLVVFGSYKEKPAMLVVDDNCRRWLFHEGKVGSYSIVGLEGYAAFDETEFKSIKVFLEVDHQIGTFIELQKNQTK